MTDMISNLESMLASGQDNALLRHTLGSHYFNAGDAQRAVDHLREAVRLDPAYSAAWKMYGKSLVAVDNLEGARAAYTQGIQAAEKKGDIQAAREMEVFLRRVQKQLAGQSS